MENKRMKKRSQALAAAPTQRGEFGIRIISTRYNFVPREPLRLKMAILCIQKIRFFLRLRHFKLILVLYARFTKERKNRLR